ncbi:MAG: MFS transporter [Actinobacteria bacterium]|nr:MFS transporter [Actinomycetota bacterium]
MNNKNSIKDYAGEIPNFLSVFITPIYFMTVGPMLLEMSADTGFGTGNLGLIVTFFTIGLILGQLTSVYFNRQFSKIRIIIFSYIIIIALLVTLFFLKNLYLFYIVYFVVGYAAGLIWLQATQYILESKITNKDRLTTVFLSFYPVGNFTGPFIVSLLIKNGIYWRYNYFVTAGLALIILILYVILKTRYDRTAVFEEKEKISFRATFTDKRINTIFTLGCILLLFYAVSETVIAAWAPTFLRTVRFFEIEMASLAVSIFWMSILAGRIVVSFIAGRIKTNYIMLTLSCIGFISMAFLVFAKSLWAIFILIGLSGLGCSGIVTLGISSASTVYEKGRGLLASLVFGAVNTGLSAAPFITKLISSHNMLLSIAAASIFMFLTGIFILGKILYERKAL